MHISNRLSDLCEHKSSQVERNVYQCLLNDVLENGYYPRHTSVIMMFPMNNRRKMKAVFCLFLMWAPSHCVNLWVFELWIGFWFLGKFLNTNSIFDVKES